MSCASQHDVTSRALHFFCIIAVESGKNSPSVEYLTFAFQNRQDDEKERLGSCHRPGSPGRNLVTKCTVAAWIGCWN